MTHEGGILGVELTDFVKQLEMANGELPTLFSADVIRVVAAVKEALTLETGGKGYQAWWRRDSGHLGRWSGKDRRQ